MAYNYEYPYTDYERYNSDWAISKVREMVEAFENLRVDWETFENTLKQSLADWEQQTGDALHQSLTSWEQQTGDALHQSLTSWEQQTGDALQESLASWEQQTGDTLNAKIDVYQSTVNESLSSMQDTLNAQVSRLDGEITGVKSGINSEVARLDGEIASITNGLAGTNASLTDLTGRVSSLESTSAAQGNQIASQGNQIASQGNQIASQGTEIDALDSRTEALEDTAAAQANEILNLSRRLLCPNLQQLVGNTVHLFTLGLSSSAYSSLVTSIQSLGSTVIGHSYPWADYNDNPDGVAILVISLSDMPYYQTDESRANLANNILKIPTAFTSRALICIGRMLENNNILKTSIIMKNSAEYNATGINPYAVGGDLSATILSNAINRNNYHGTLAVANVSETVKMSLLNDFSCMIYTDSDEPLNIDEIVEHIRGILPPYLRSYTVSGYGVGGTFSMSVSAGSKVSSSIDGGSTISRFRGILSL